MRARQPNSSHWTRPVRKRRHYHRQWSGSIHGPYDVTEHGLGNWQLRKFRWQSGVQVHVGGGRSSACNFWCFWYDGLLEQPIEWTFMTNCPSSLKTFLLRLQVRPSLKGFFSVCGLLTVGRRNRITKSLQMWACLKLDKKYWRTQASMPLCELWNFNGNELQIG